MIPNIGQQAASERSRANEEDEEDLPLCFMMSPTKYQVHGNSPGDS
jgi:hypothetical protein